MQNYRGALLLSAILSTLLLTACSSGGGGGGGDDGNNAAQVPAPENPTQNNGSTPPDDATTPPPGSKASDGTVSGYTYVTPSGREYVMRQSGIYISGQTIWSLQPGKETTAWCCGRMSYTTYGAWKSKDESQAAVFYTGEPTAANAVPTQGTATYVGSGMRGEAMSAANFQVDFAAKTINGNIAGSEAFGSDVAMQGQIADGGFRGAAQSAGQAGTFVGHFNGPAAQELGGIAEFADSKLSASFGATAQ